MDNYFAMLILMGGIIFFLISYYCFYHNMIKNSQKRNSKISGRYPKFYY